MVTLFFFIFEPPQLLDFTDEPFNQGGISRELNCFYFSHKVPVMVIVAVIVTKDASVVRRTASQVDVNGRSLLRHRLILLQVGSLASWLFTTNDPAYRPAGRTND
jgi:hypothetical protein